MVLRVVCKLMERFSTGSPIAAGIRQGCVAAPDLFHCITDRLMDAVCNSFPNVQLRDYDLTNLNYVNDTTQFAGWVGGGISHVQ